MNHVQDKKRWVPPFSWPIRAEVERSADQLGQRPGATTVAPGHSGGKGHEGHCPR
jgi:hypothetical protein